MPDPPFALTHTFQARIASWINMPQTMPDKGVRSMTCISSSPQKSDRKYRSMDVWSLALRGDLHGLRRFVCAANVNARDSSSRTPLMCAVHSSSCVQELLLRGAAVDDVNAFGQSALTMAARKGCTSVVQLLLAHKASCLEDHDRCSPLWWAVDHDQRECFRALIQGGALLEREAPQSHWVGWAVDEATGLRRKEVLRFWHSRCNSPVLGRVPKDVVLIITTLMWAPLRQWRKILNVEVPPLHVVQPLQVLGVGFVSPLNSSDDDRSSEYYTD